MVLSAAQLAKGRLSEMTTSRCCDQLNVNYLGPVTVARASQPYLRETRGHLVLFTSSSYTRGRADYVMYSSTKAAVVNLAQALADEWSADGIHVNVINPERTRTPMRLQAFGDEPEGTLLESEAVASTVLDVLASTSRVTSSMSGARATDQIVSEPDRVAEAVAEAQAETEAQSGGSTQ